MFDAKLNGDTRLFISEYELSGIENMAMSYSAQQNTFKPLGTNGGFTNIAGKPDQTLSFSRYLIYDDPIFDYISGDPISGSLHYENSSYGFFSGYLTDYSVNCAVGSVPKVNAAFFVADEMKPAASASGSNLHPNIDIPTQGSISLVCDHKSTNRVIGFDYALKCEHRMYYGIGSENLQDVEFVPPIQYTANIQIEVDDAFLASGYDFLDERENKTLSFNMQGRTGTLLQSVDLPNASLVGENLSMSAEGALRLTLNYVGHGY